MATILDDVSSDPSNPQDGATPSGNTVQAPSPAPTPVPAPVAAGQNHTQAPSSQASEFSTVTPEEQHANFFQKAFGVLAGGSQSPQRNPDGSLKTDASGRVVTQQASVKQLGAGILAGALASMMAGYAAGAPHRDGNGIVTSNLPAAAQAGAEAGAQQTQNNRVNVAQKQADEQRLRQYTTIDQNMKQVATGLSIHRIQLENQELGDKLVNERTATYAPIATWLDQNQNNPQVKAAIVGQHMSYDAVHKLLADDQAHGLKHTAVADGSEIGPDGNLQNTYTVVDNSVSVPAGEFKGFGYDNLAPSQQIPIAQLMGKAGNAVTESVVRAGLDSLGQYGNGKGFADVKKENPYLMTPQIMSTLQAVGGLTPSQADAYLRKNAPTAVSAIEKTLGLTPVIIEADANRLVAQAEAAKKEAGLAGNPDKQPADTGYLAQLQFNARSLGLSNNQATAILSEVPKVGATRADVAKANENIRAQQNQNINQQIARQNQADREASKRMGDAVLTTPDALGFTPNVPEGVKEYDKRRGTFKKNADDLQKTEGTYQQFNSILNDVNSGKDLTGAQSVVALFNAIGISATPLAGKGFRINNNTIQEHAEARGLGQSLYQKFLGLKDGDVITPQQIKDYANIAMQARESQYVNLVNQVHNQGLNADFVLPTGNGQSLDPNTAKIFLQLSGGNVAKARGAAQVKGWNL